MREFKIITDSGCDLSYEIINSLDIEYLGLECEIEGTWIIEDGGKIFNYRDFYEKLIQGAMPKTSQITPNRFILIFEKYISMEYDILYIALSSALSGTFNSALIAREEILERYPEANIKIIDSKAASSGQGLLAYTAAKLKEEGKSLNEVADYIDDCKRNLYHFFTVKDLKHLERGGRINSTSAIVGRALNINPILTINKEGTLEVIKNVRGEKKVLKELIKYICENICGDDLNIVIISHADNDKSVEFLLCLIKEKFKVKDVIISYMGLAVGSHTGQGAVGVYFFGKRRK